MMDGGFGERGVSDLGAETWGLKVADAQVALGMLLLGAAIEHVFGDVFQ